ncbi:MUC15 protein, partial [Heliornis fulica]|nr:MUC15 protein [Heliornis fulica]
VQPFSGVFVLPGTTARNPSATSHAAPTAHANTSGTQRRGRTTPPRSTPPRPTNGTTSSSDVTMLSKDAINTSVTSFSRRPMSLVTLTTTSDSSGATKSAAATSTSTETASNSPPTYSTLLSPSLPSGNTSANPTTLLPTGITLTSPMVKQDSPTSNFNPVQQTTEVNLSNPSAASPNSKDVNEDKANKGRIIVGVTAGAILGSVLIGLIGYFICGKKRSESFSHRRLYEDTRNDPVLHLDNSLGPYDTSFGCAADRGEAANAGCPSSDIPMADMTPSQPSP